MENKYNGLNDKEVIKNQQLYGLNILNNDKNNNLLEIIKNPMIIILILIIILYIMLNQKLNALILGILTILIIVIELLQKNKIQKLSKILKENSDSLYTVIRNSKQIKIKSEEVTIDDILLLKEGDKVIVDGIILESNNLKVIEKVITKNDNSIKKSIDLINKDAKYKSNYLYAGTIITNGYATIKVINIGNQTEYAKINKKNKNLIELKIAKMNKLINIFALISLIFVSILLGFKNSNFKLGILLGLTSAISILPLNLPLTVSLFATFNIYNFYKNNILIKDLSIIKKLNLITYLCIDKSKFITKGKLEIKDIYTSLTTIDYVEKLLFAKENKKNNQIEKAIIDYGNILGIQNINEDYELIKTYPFTNESKLNANVYKKDDEYYIFVKGSLESLFDICNLDVEEKYELHNLQKKLSKKGLEIVASGSKKIKKIEDDIFDYRINFDGLIILHDKINENMKVNIETLKNYDIKTIMLSKDNKEISSVVGKQINLNNYNNIINGKELDKINDDELNSIIKNIGIFSNVKPKHKLRIINSLKINNEFIGVTGYETSDIEMLNRSDISISMGNNISKNITDITIMDDNFETFVNTIKESKKLYNNIKKILKTILPTYIITILFVLSILIVKPIYSLPIYIIILKIIINTILNNKK
ncbi:MAG: HAD-IC family P-type ATPase [Bacilli bacterium]|nr:HAD-IC family P-type ATPase [Bacilli bacterium]